MTTLRILIAMAVGALTLGGCVHTPPGTSVKLALAQKAKLVRLPSQRVGVARRGTAEPELPSNNKVVLVADAFTRGQGCMKAGKDEEAIVAFEETVKLDPQLHDAWQCLAMLYEKTGQPKKAIEAFRKSKKLARG